MFGQMRRPGSQNADVRETMSQLDLICSSCYQMFEGDLEIPSLVCV